VLTPTPQGHPSVCIISERLRRRVARGLYYVRRTPRISNEAASFVMPYVSPLSVKFSGPKGRRFEQRCVSCQLLPLSLALFSFSLSLARAHYGGNVITVRALSSSCREVGHRRRRRRRRRRRCSTDVRATTSSRVKHSDTCSSRLVRMKWLSSIEW